MNELGITNTGHLSNFSGRQKFWRRQFAAQETLAQLIFDVTFGVIAPLLCVIFDPVVFRARLMPEPLLGGFRIFTYILIFIEISSLLVWLVCGRAVTRSRILGGILLAGGLFSAVIGLVLLPFSFLGLMFAGIGLFGFTPFLTGLIYLRNGRRALRHAKTDAPVPGRRLTPVLLSALLALALPAAAQWQVTRLITQATRVLIDDDTTRAAAATWKLKYVRRLTGEELNELVWAYGREQNAARKARLAHAYAQITGLDIETRYHYLGMLSD